MFSMDFLCLCAKHPLELRFKNAFVFLAFFSVPLSHCVSVLKIFASLRPCAFALNSSAFAFACSAAHSLPSAESASAADTRESLASLSGFSRASRLHVVSFQRFFPCFPPAISAVNMQFVQQLQHKKEGC